MAKGKQPYGSRKASAADLAHLEDGMSIASSTSTGNYSKGEQDAEGEVITDTYQDGIDKLFEKRGATRVQGLDELVSYLRKDVRTEESDRNCATLIDRCTGCLRKGGAQERQLASTALGLHFLSMSSATESLLDDVRTELELLAAEGPAEARSAAVEALAMCCFIGSEEHTTPREIMDLMHQLWRKGAAGPRAACLRGWALLFTSLDSVLGSSEVQGLLREMMVLVGDKSVDVRSAAGELVALLCSTYGLGQQSDSDGDDDDGEDDEDIDDVVHQVLMPPGSIDGLVDRMRDLATHNRGDATRTSKRNKASLRAAFRPILSDAEGAATKAEKVKLQHGDVLSVNTLAGKTALMAFRRLLSGGVQAHLQRNPLLHAVLGFSPAEGASARLSAMEKRSTRSPNSALSRGKTAERKSERANKSRSRMATVEATAEEY